MMIENYIIPTSRRLADFFYSREFCIPSYQRSYDWPEELVEELLMDFHYAIDQEESCYFLGIIILSSGDEGKLEVIDGQQRIVTLSLLMLGFRDFIKKEKLFSDDDKVMFELSKMLWTSPISSNTNKTPRLMLNNEVSNSFYHNMLSEKKQLQPQDHVSKRLKKAYDRIMAFLTKEYGSNGVNKEQFGGFIEFILNKVMIVAINTDKEKIDAYEVFEVLNDRRLELAQVDLLKNYLFRKMEGHHNKNAVIEQWENLEERFRRNKETDLKHCIESYFLAKVGYFQPKKLYSVVRNHTEGKTSGKSSNKDSKEITKKIVSYMDDLDQNNAATYYLQIRNNNQALWKEFPPTTAKYVNFLREFNILYSTLLVPLLKDWDYESIDRYYQIIYYLMLRIYSTTGSLPINRLQPLFTDLAHQIYTDKLDNLKEINQRYLNNFQDSYRQVTDDDTFMSLFSSLSFRVKKAKKILLALVKDSQQIEIDDLDCVPVLPYKGDPRQWNNFDKESREHYCQRLGNYILLEADLIEDSMDKLPYEQKTTSYFRSRMSMTRSLMKEFPQWSPASIRKRQENMSKEACKLWSINRIEV